jgi:hypothetical protein
MQNEFIVSRATTSDQQKLTALYKNSHQQKLTALYKKFHTDLNQKIPMLLYKSSHRSDPISHSIWQLQSDLIVAIVCLCSPQEIREEEREGK